MIQVTGPVKWTQAVVRRWKNGQVAVDEFHHGFTGTRTVVGYIWRGDLKWVLIQGNGNYSIGTFNGTEFQEETGRQPCDVGPNFYATQSWHNTETGDGRRIQAAWMRRDGEKLRPILTEEMHAVFAKHIDAARAKGQTNKLENITVRSVEPTEAWQEQGQDYITVRLLANLLDYTVDETTGKVVDGNDSAPVKFEEFWTWVRPVGRNDWRLSAINQAD